MNTADLVHRDANTWEIPKARDDARPVGRVARHVHRDRGPAPGAAVVKMEAHVVHLPDCWLAAENLMIAATALGLATCPIGFAVASLADPAIKSELGIPHEVTAIAPIIVGYAASEPPRTTRRDPEILAWKR